MMKVKIISTNRTQQVNVINKARKWGAAARDGDYGPVEGKTAVVVNTKLGGGTPAIQLSRHDYSPSKSAYDIIMPYKDFMNASVCPWDSKQKLADGAPANDVAAQVVVTPVVAVPTGPCAQDTLKIKSCTVLEQEAIGFETLGLPYLQEAGVEVTMHDGVPYILNTKKNEAKKLTAKTAAKKAHKDLLKDKTGSVWATYARTFDLVTDICLTKDVEAEED